MTKRHIVMPNGVYQTIKNRFWDLYRINIANYIKIEDDMQIILWESHTTGGGFGFEPTKPEGHLHLISALRKTGKFHLDDGREPFGAAAGSQHKGAQSWREEGIEHSLHCAIAPDECSCHIDAYGFVLTDPEGRSYYDPDLFQHIVHDLGWQWLVRKAWAKSSLLGEALSRVHPHVPTSSDKYRVRAGIGVDLFDVKDRKGEDRYKLTVDFSGVCDACDGSRLGEKNGPVLTVVFEGRF